MGGGGGQERRQLYLNHVGLAKSLEGYTLECVDVFQGNGAFALCSGVVASTFQGPVGELARVKHKPPPLPVCSSKCAASLRSLEQHAGDEGHVLSWRPLLLFHLTLVPLPFSIHDLSVHQDWSVSAGSSSNKSRPLVLSSSPTRSHTHTLARARTHTLSLSFFLSL